MDPLALDRLDEHRRDPPIGERAAPALQIAEGDLSTFGEERLEASSQPLGR